MKDGRAIDMAVYKAVSLNSRFLELFRYLCAFPSKKCRCNNSWEPC